MSLLGNRYNFIDDEQEEESYTLPAVITKKDEDDFSKALAISSVLHPIVIALVWLFGFIFMLLGIDFSRFNRPDLIPKKDIEFVLVDHEAMPRNPNTKNRADMNSRSGGKNNPKKPVSLPSASASKPSSSASSLQKMIQKQQKQIQNTQKQVIKQQHVQQQRIAQTPAPQKQASQAPRPSTQRPAPPSVAPSAKPVSAPPKVAIKPSTPFAVPVPSGLPAGKSFSTGPVGGTSSQTGSKTGGGYAGRSSAGRYAPAPSLAPSGSGGGGQLARGGGGTGSNVGNPGGGGGRPGIDAIREPNFGPYMRELQRKIKLNWNPPKGDESKRVVLLFKIAKSGRMLSCRVLKSSGLPAADQAALRAVELTAPFRPLPVEFRGQSIDIQFTFDYNVFGARY